MEKIGGKWRREKLEAQVVCIVSWLWSENAAWLTTEKDKPTRFNMVLWFWNVLLGVRGTLNLVGGRISSPRGRISRIIEMYNSSSEGFF